MKLIALLVLCVVAAIVMAGKSGDMPVIGILTMPMSPEEDSNNFSFIDTSYVKFLQGGGATVVPILFNSTSSDIKDQMDQLDGVFFTGGAAMPQSFPRYYKTATLLYNLAIEQSKTLWGTCLGFQTISDISVNSQDILGDYPQMNIALALDFTEYGDKSSKIYSSLSNDMKSLFTDHSFTQNWHNYGVGYDVFLQKMKPLGFEAVSTNVDTNGIKFVSTFEHTEHKIFATQWHPEANQYDPDPKDASGIVHSTEATTAMNYMAEFIISQARLTKRAKEAARPKKNDHMLQGHQSTLPNAIELFPVRAVISEDDTAFHYHFE